jgi:DHA1 family bicyclomycin/chloramphenicol resistance-like MFS transporter
MAVEPRLAGTASGVGVCMQNLLGALSTQVYGLLADGTVWPLIITCGTASVIMLCFGVTPWLQRRARRD